MFDSMERSVVKSTCVVQSEGTTSGKRESEDDEVTSMGVEHEGSSKVQERNREEWGNSLSSIFFNL